MSNPNWVVTKSEFAKICGVVPGRVSQWIGEGKISGEALVGEGRSARIRVEVALAQLKLRRDIGQALGNGLDTQLVPPRPQAQMPAAGDDPDQDGDADSSADRYGGWSSDGASDDIDRALKRARLEAAERDNRLAASKEAAAKGIYTETASARTEMGKVAGQMMRIFEGALPEIATAIAAEFQIDARDVTHHLNEQFRKVREQAAEAAAKAASIIPETVVVDA